MKLLYTVMSIFSLSSLFSAETSVPIPLIQSLLPENPIIIEAGAQFGEDTDKMSSLWPKGTIYAFEPSPSSYQSLVEVSLRRENVFSFPLAVSDQSGTMPFYLAGGASSLLIPDDNFNRDYFHVDVNKPIYVDVIVLDDWMEQQHIDKLDFIWLDMEGNELHALEGLKKHLSDVTLIYAEVNIQRFWNGCVCYEELKSWLANEGFTEIWVEIVPDWQGNALFANTRKLKKL